MPRIDLYANLHLVMKLKLSDNGLLIGRASDCDMQLPLDRVSRHHARIEPQYGGYAITDLSANGTRLNASMLKGTEALSPGDRVYIEDYVLIYQPDEAPSENLQDETTLLV